MCFLFLSFFFTLNRFNCFGLSLFTASFYRLWTKIKQKTTKHKCVRFTGEYIIITICRITNATKLNFDGVIKMFEWKMAGHYYHLIGKIIVFYRFRSSSKCVF